MAPLNRSKILTIVSTLAWIAATTLAYFAGNSAGARSVCKPATSSSAAPSGVRAPGAQPGDWVPRPLPAAPPSDPRQRTYADLFAACRLVGCSLSGLSESPKCLCGDVVERAP